MGTSRKGGEGEPGTEPKAERSVREIELLPSTWKIRFLLNTQQSGG